MFERSQATSEQGVPRAGPGITTRWELLGNRPGSWAAVIVVLALFVLFGYARYRHGSGDDLASSYVGSRLLIEGHASHLFHYDPVSFAEIGDDDLWMQVANRSGFHGFLHPYVQTPLWAYLLQPLCRQVSFPAFNRIFTMLEMLCFAGALWLTAKYWAKSFFNPLALLVTCLCLLLSQPFQYAMFLNQTHMLFVFLTLVALVLAERKRPIAAGLLLACAAAVKVTPILLVLYWLMTRRGRAAASALLWSGLLWAVTVMAVGSALMHTYLTNLSRISGVLLLAQNNQSFAAWWMAHFYPFDEVFDINIFPLPKLMRLSSTLLTLGLTAWGGWIDRQRETQEPGRAPLGAMIAMVAATIFAPIAWTHYSIVLLMPLMMLVDSNRKLHSRAMWVLVVAALLLNYRPLATDINNGLIGAFSIVRGQFFSGLLTMLALSLMGLAQVRPKVWPLYRKESVACES